MLVVAQGEILGDTFALHFNIELMGEAAKAQALVKDVPAESTASRPALLSAVSWLFCVSCRWPSLSGSSSPKSSPAPTSTPA